MRIYRAAINDLQVGTYLSWHSSKSAAWKWVNEQRRSDREAARDYARLQQEDDENGTAEALYAPRGDEILGAKVGPVDFTPTRSGVLRLLRAHTPDTDNG
jgi:hypothetical protein